MTHKTLRNVLGLTSISALALAMVGCGGSSSSSPQTASNQAPTNVQIVGPTNMITKHPYTFQLSATDPEGDAIIFNVNGTDLPAGQTAYTLTPQAVVDPAATVLTVIAKDSKGAAAAAKTHASVVIANRVPQFISQASAVLNGVGNTISWTNFQVVAQDPDTDDVKYTVSGTPSFVDNTGAAVTGCTVAINPTTGMVSFTGAVPAGKTSVIATFTVQAEDKLPGSSTLLGGTSTQLVTMTYNNGNIAPTIVTTSLPNLPLNHRIPVSHDASGFPVQAVDVNPGDVITWSMTSSVPGLVLSNPTGTTTTIITNNQFVPLTTLAQPIQITLTATDSFGLSDVKVLSITPVADAKPVLNSSTYTETVSGVRFFDKAQVKDQITSRARFYPEAIEWIDASDTTTADWTFGYAGYNYTTWRSVESDHPADPMATDTQFSNPFAGGADVPVAGWTARTLFRDPEGDGIAYQMDPRSVYVSSPYWPVGQPFTLESTGGPANVFPVLGGLLVPYFWAPDPGEFPSIDVDTGRMTWFPVLVEDDAPTYYTDFGYWAQDNNGNIIWANPSIWSFTVQGYEKIWNPATQTYELLNDPSQVARIDYSIKVQPNNTPWIGALCTIPNSVSPVVGDPVVNQVWASTELPIGGGASISTTAYGRPSIQEPESRRYDITGGTGFDYSAANTVKPAIWRWLVARAGGSTAQPEDVQIYDPDNTVNSGHMDAIHASMGTPTVPAADTTGNVPALMANTKTFYNPWIDGNIDKGAFAVTWGPNRLQYLIARVTASAAYEFPVEVRDQYQRISDRDLGINPIFGTVRYTNARTRWFYDMASEVGAVKRGGTLLASGTPGDPVVAPGVTNRYTFSYLPFPGTTGDGTERDFADVLCTDFFAGTGPASGIAQVNANPAADLYSVASWITLYATESHQVSYHTGNPLNNETGSFNLPSYAQANDGTSTASTRSDWKNVDYTWVNGQNPTNPVINNEYAVGSWANHEVRAQVIPSNSPFIMSMSSVWNLTYFNGNFPTELQGSTLQVPQRPEAPWYLRLPAARGWHYGIYQSEIDYQNAVAGRQVAFSENTISNDDPTKTRLRWTYSWPTQVTRANHEVTVGGANKWIKGDVMQIAIPNMGANSRFFFTGDGAQNDTQAAVIRGWGAFGITTGVGIVDTDAVLGTPANNTALVTGLSTADNTPFHVPSNSIWVPNNTFLYAGAVLSANIPYHLNLPNRTSFAPGATATQLGFRGFKGYMDSATFTVPASVDPAYQFRIVDGTVYGNTNPALIDMAQDDQIYFLWMRQDATVKTAWAVWDASKMVTDANGTYTATGGLTTVPGFTMEDHEINSTLPASYLNDAQVSLSEGALPGQNHASNVVVKTDASLYNASILNAKGWARSQWGTMAYNMGYQPAGITTNNVRLVNPRFDTANAARYNNQIVEFRTTDNTLVSFEGGVRDSAIVYAVRKHTDEKGNANAELGLAGIEPGSPVLAQWYNLQLKDDPALDAATVASTTLTDVVTAWPKCYSFYSPFDSNWANVMELKMNFLVGVQYPGAATNLWKVPSTLANVFPLGAPVTDPSCTNPNNTINPGNPIVGPVQFLRVTDYVANTTPGTPLSTIDLVTSNVTNPLTGAGANNLAGNTFIQARSNLMVHFQANVNNQVLPSGYIVEVYRLQGDAVTTLQPTMVANYRVGHIGGKDAIQKVYLPSLHSLTGLEGGVAAPNDAVYFFKVRTVWHKGINFETQPTKQSIPMAYADFVSAPFVTN